MIRRIRKSFWTKVVTAYLLLNLVGEIVFPTMAMALTSGPVSIDQASFEPAATSEMVDLATGDFTYNIPLMDVDGYPINIAYHGGVDMDQDASMVGLGWTLNVGALNRSMRGLPDDFSGDEVVTEMNLRPNYTVGGELDVSLELLGMENINNTFGPFAANFGPNIGLGVSFNNYVGFSTELSVGFSAGISLFAEDGDNALAAVGLNGSKSSNSRGGMTTSLGAGVSILSGNIGIGIGYSANTSEGLMSKTASLTTPIGSSMKIMPVSTISYTPSISFETNTQSLNFDFGLGLQNTGIFSHAKGAYFQSLVCNKNTSEVVPAYGYLHMEDAPNLDGLLDFNQEGVMLANENIYNLPTTNHTYDLFSATAQGVGFSFRSHRGEVGTVYEPRREHTINGIGVGVELGFGNVFNAGINVDVPYGYVSSGKWTTDNLAETGSRFVGSAPGSTGIDNNFYEAAYFKKFGNRSTIDSDFYTNMGGTYAVRQRIEKPGVAHTGTGSFETKDAIELFNIADNDHYKAERDAHNTNIQYLSAEEAEFYGMDHAVSTYSLSDYDYTAGEYASTQDDRYGTLSSEAKEHHLSEMTILEGDGSRYVYGIPVINLETQEVVFNVSDESSNSAPALGRDCKHGLIKYTGGAENTMDNRRGDNNLYMKKIIPAYAGSYLLTAYLSSNYIDRTEDGLTPDDYGNYTKFNYSKTGTLNWRFPYQEDSAAYNEGLKADEYDDLGTYVYGERDQWYLHSIESKNFVAEFHYSNRHDGYGVTDENGGRSSSNATRRLVKIELYTRQRKIDGEAPIKTVHFEYDYSLCQNVPSNDNASAAGEGGVSSNQGGKLTLKSIYFTYGESNRGKLHKYRFDYSPVNPNYNLGADDRWGNYKPVPASTACDETGALTNIEFPYAEQNQSSANSNASAWMLETVHLPSGSEINIEVESDDYAYVQDVPVTKMYKIKGFSETTTFVDADKHILYEDNVTPHNYLHVVFDNLGTSAANAKANFLAHYLPSTDLYFRVLNKVTRSEDAEARYEYVSGYAEIDITATTVQDEGANGSYETVVLKLKDVALEDENKASLDNKIANPIAKASWQFTRKYLPKIINPIVGQIYQHDEGLNCDTEWEVPVYPIDGNPGLDEGAGGEETQDEGQFLADVVNTGKSHLQNIIAQGGINKMMCNRMYSAECVVAKSWVRLGMGSNAKLGGGHRVKQITVDDNWNDVKSSESESTYGSVYTYETTENGAVITSGVASYEPIGTGGDENPMRQPLHYTVDVKMRVDDAEFQELPFGESIFANPTVAYSKVSVENIPYEDVTQNSTGQTVYEHYTSKDFPIIFAYTDAAFSNRLKDVSSGWMGLFTGESYNYLTMSQGYMIHLNDMHGKFKSKKVFGAQLDQSLEAPEVYSMEHHYYTNSDDPKELENMITVVDETGFISTRIIGRDIDLVVNANQSKSFYETITYQAGLDFFTLFGAPVAIPSVWAYDMTVENRYRSSSTTKIITSTGILEEVILKDKGRYKSSKNLLFDANTGVPVVTEINHEQPKEGSTYEKPIYQYDYPAYWMYEGMGLAAENWGATFLNVVDADGAYYEITTTSFSGYENFLNPGDELSVFDVDDQSYEVKCWIVKNETNDEYYLVDKYGNNPTFNLAHDIVYKVIRSGKRNLLGSTAASVTSLTKFTTSPYADGFAHTGVLNASAVEYTERAFGYKSSKVLANNENLCGLVANDTINPYVQGLLGNWNLLSSYVYDYTRNQSTGNARIDGVLTAYEEFWENNSGAWVKNTDPAVAERWIRAALATLFDREGFNLESQDALGIYSAILLGYNNTLKIAEAVNARYYEIGFNGFEDEAYEVTADCSKDHFDFLVGATGLNSVSTEEAHTGRNSFKIGYDNNSYHNAVVVNSVNHAVSDHTRPYIIQEQELIKPNTFIVPTIGSSKYVFTTWVKVVNKGQQFGTSYDDAVIEIQYDGSTLAHEEHRTPIIDGWQRVECIFEIPGSTISTTKICQIRVENNSEGALYFDDARVQPYNSEMVSYVIDPVTLRLWATLDSRNFATFYQYDEEGSLVRIIQETERGRITVQENRAGIRIE
jgi:hypothetical protein